MSICGGQLLFSIHERSFKTIRFVDAIVKVADVSGRASVRQTGSVFQISMLAKNWGSGGVAHETR
jgi:hypothetical protein